MAESKSTTKKTTPKNTAKVDKKTAVKGKTLEELRANYVAARKSHAAGELVNPRVLGQYRKAIARQLTAQNVTKEEK